MNRARERHAAAAVGQLCSQAQKALAAHSRERDGWKAEADRLKAELRDAKAAQGPAAAPAAPTGDGSAVPPQAPGAPAAQAPGMTPKATRAEVLATGPDAVSPPPG